MELIKCPYCGGTNITVEKDGKKIFYCRDCKLFFSGGENGLGETRGT